MAEVLRQNQTAQRGWADIPLEGEGPDAAARPGLPEKFGPYILTERLGSGGLAEVLKGHLEDDPAQSPVAIKRLLRQDENGLLRLLEEGRLASRISDEHVVRVLQQSSVNNRPYLIMQYVEGTNLDALSRRLRRRRQFFPTEVILALLIEAGRGLQAAHDFRDPETNRPECIVHNDLKPSNILVARDGMVKLTDFGVAQQQGSDAALANGELGTLAYMAPERVTLDKGALIDQRSDIFSLGAVAYELCTMHPLINGAAPRMIQQLLNAETFIPQQLNTMPDRIHSGLRDIIAKMLEVAPGRRFDRAETLVLKLIELRDHLKLPADLAHFVAPYLSADPLELVGERVTSHMPGLKGPAGHLPQVRSAGPITHLTAEQLTEMLRKPVEVAADPGALSRQRRARFQRGLILTGILLALVTLAGSLVFFSMPTRLEVATTPAGAMGWAQVGCDGPMVQLQPTPFVYHTTGPWPLCMRFEAPGFVPLTTRVYQPVSTRTSERVDLVLTREVCVEVDSKPPNLPIYVDNIQRGVTTTSTVKVCGLEPAIPYVVQLEYRGERWDVQEINAAAGETVSVFHDFGGSVEARATPMQRCRRYFRAKQYPRAIEICRVAVTQSEDYKERVEALVIEGRAYLESNGQAAGCDTLHSALGTAVSNRDIDLEQEVQDWRTKYSCGPQIQLLNQDKKKPGAAAGAPAPGAPGALVPPAAPAPVPGAPGAAAPPAPAAPGAAAAPAKAGSGEVVR